MTAAIDVITTLTAIGGFVLSILAWSRLIKSEAPCVDFYFVQDSVGHDGVEGVISIENPSRRSITLTSLDWIMPDSDGIGVTLEKQDIDRTLKIAFEEAGIESKNIKIANLRIPPQEQRNLRVLVVENWPSLDVRLNWSVTSSWPERLFFPKKIKCNRKMLRAMEKAADNLNTL